MSTLNCPEEVELAHKLVEMHPWADMVRFARSGGEATAIAIRIARAFTQRDTAICDITDGMIGTLRQISVAVQAYHNTSYLVSTLSVYQSPLRVLLEPFSIQSLQQITELFNNCELAAVKWKSSVQNHHCRAF